MYLETTLAIHLHSLVVHSRKDRPRVVDIIDVGIVLFSPSLPHNTSNTLYNIRLWGRQYDRVKCWYIQTLVGLTERREDDFLLGRRLEVRLLHTTHIEARGLWETLVKHLTMPSPVTEYEELSCPRGRFFDQFHEHLVSLPVLDNLGDHIGH